MLEKEEKEREKREEGKGRKGRKAISPEPEAGTPTFLSTGDDVPRQLADRPPFPGFSSARPTVPIFIFIAAPVNATSTYTGVP